MFESLTDRLQRVFKSLRGQAKLSEKNIADALREVRLALLEADVNFRVVKRFINKIQERAIGKDVMRSLTPGQQVIKIVHEELVNLIGSKSTSLIRASSPPSVYMLVGLQGSGKTTSCAKLAKTIKKEGRKTILVAADIYRPAAIDQLKTLGRQIDVDVFAPGTDLDPVEICEKGLENAKTNGVDTVIFDTAGRLHIDKALMEELQQIKQQTNPSEILLVADAMTGQDAVNIAESFNNDLDITGVILTKLDGDARGGAAISIKSVTGKPIKLAGVGEKLDPLEVFHPDRMASRILGMGDVLSFIEKAESAVTEEQRKEMERKILESSFTLEDFRDQLKQLQKMGSIEQLMQMIPGMGKMKQMHGAIPSDKDFIKIEAIINSMTPIERRNHKIINTSRRRRIANGSGTDLIDVNRMLKQFDQARKMMKKMKKSKNFAKQMQQQNPFFK